MPNQMPYKFRCLQNVLGYLPLAIPGLLVKKLKIEKYRNRGLTIKILKNFLILQIIYFEFFTEFFTARYRRFGIER